MPKNTKKLRNFVERDEILLAPGVCDAMEAKIAEQQGAEAIYIGGNALASSIHGNPDIGLTSFKETLDRAWDITSAVDLPVICDADDGYGNALNVIRTVKQFEKVGVAGIHIEDQVSPKKCGHLENKQLVTKQEMINKITAATDTRQDEDFLIISRTDAIATDGIDAAIERARMYHENGADMVFLDAAESRDHLEVIGHELNDVPILTNIPYGGKTPLCSASDVESLGFDVMVFAAIAQKARIHFVEEIFKTILETGDEREIIDKLGTWQDRNRITEYQEWMNKESQYSNIQ